MASGPLLVTSRNHVGTAAIGCPPSEARNLLLRSAERAYKSPARKSSAFWQLESRGKSTNKGTFDTKEERPEESGRIKCVCLHPVKVNLIIACLARAIKKL